MEDGLTDISLDRILMRIKDLILIIGALWAGVKYLYFKPLEIQAELERQRVVLTQIDKTLIRHGRLIERIRQDLATR